MKINTLTNLLFVALLVTSFSCRLLSEENVAEDPAKKVADGGQVVAEKVEAQDKAPENQPEKVEGQVEPKTESKEAEKKQEPPKKSNVGLFILIGVSVLGIIAIATTFILGRQKH